MSKRELEKVLDEADQAAAYLGLLYLMGGVFGGFCLGILYAMMVAS